MQKQGQSSKANFVVNYLETDFTSKISLGFTLILKYNGHSTIGHLNTTLLLIVGKSDHESPNLSLAHLPHNCHLINDLYDLNT